MITLPPPGHPATQMSGRRWTTAMEYRIGLDFIRWCAYRDTLKATACIRPAVLTVTVSEGPNMPAANEQGQQAGLI
jgi:hypothetical protein